MRIALFVATCTIAATLAMAACGGTTPAEKETSTPAGSTASTPAASTAPVNRCPLTVEQVSAALGVPMKADAACTFFPDDADRAFPNAVYVAQDAMACSATMLEETGYTEKVDGFPYPAYIVDEADGSSVLVCRDNRPFEVQVDMANDAKSRAAAVALAKQIVAEL